MRLSVDKKDRGYTSVIPTHGVVVFKDGYQVNDCITADEELGLAIVHKRDLHGEFIFNSAKDEVERKYIMGRINIVLNRSSKGVW